jgi:hypothetical protein
MNNTQRKLYKELYSKIHSEKSKKAYAERKEACLYSGTAPLGYTWLRHGSERRGKSFMVVDHEKKLILQEIYRLYNTCAYSYVLIKREIEKRFKVSYSRSAIGRFLTHEFYNGFMNGKQHSYERIIDDATFARAQEVLKIRSKKSKKKQKHLGKIYLFKCIFLCDVCECAITAEKHKGHIYYHCTQSKYKHKAPYISEHLLIDEFELVFKEYSEFFEAFKKIKQQYLKNPSLELLVTLRTLIYKNFNNLRFTQNKTILYDVGKPAEEKPIEKPKEYFDSLTKDIAMMCLEKSQTIECIAQQLHEPIHIIQNKLIAMQLDGLIDQTLNGEWVTL